MLFSFFILCFLILVVNKNLLLTLIALEIIGFVVIYYVVLNFSSCISRDYLALLTFSVLVIEGVIALCGLIMLVRFRGRDYLISRTFLKL